MQALFENELGLLSYNELLDLAKRLIKSKDPEKFDNQLVMKLLCTHSREQIIQLIHILNDVEEMSSEQQAEQDAEETR